MPGLGNSHVLGPTWATGDRVSATLINAKMTREPSGSMPIFSAGLSGVILSPEHNKLLCSHPYDADTLFRTCTPRGGGRTTEGYMCIPGCTLNGNGPKWCTDIRGTDDQFPCAWLPSQTGKMLMAREVIRSSGEKPYHKRFDDDKFYGECEQRYSRWHGACEHTALASTLLCLYLTKHQSSRSMLS